MSLMLRSCWKKNDEQLGDAGKKGEINHHASPIIVAGLLPPRQSKTKQNSIGCYAKIQADSHLLANYWKDDNETKGIHTYYF